MIATNTAMRSEEVFIASITTACDADSLVQLGKSNTPVTFLDCSSALSKRSSLNHQTELVYLGLIAMMAGAGADLFNRTCFNYPTLGDLYKYATYAAIPILYDMEQVRFYGARVLLDLRCGDRPRHVLIG